MGQIWPASKWAIWTEKSAGRVRLPLIFHSCMRVGFVLLRLTVSLTEFSMFKLYVRIGIVTFDIRFQLAVGRPGK